MYVNLLSLSSWWAVTQAHKHRERQRCPLTASPRLPASPDAPTGPGGPGSPCGPIKPSGPESPWAP